MDASTDRMRAVRTAGWKYIRNYLPAIPYQQHNAYKESQYPTWNLVKELAATGQLPPAAAAFAASRKPIEELYRLTDDPHEVRNLAADPAHAKKLRELRDLVSQWVVDSGDQGFRMEDPLDIFRGYNGRLPDEPESKKGAGK
jgi:N-sulfoglucosamine sulfohydrolase